MTTKRKQCPSCGASFTKGGMVHMLAGKILKRRTVCAKCERSAIRILVEPPMRLSEVRRKASHWLEGPGGGP